MNTLGLDDDDKIRIKTNYITKKKLHKKLIRQINMVEADSLILFNTILYS